MRVRGRLYVSAIRAGSKSLVHYAGVGPQSQDSNAMHFGAGNVDRVSPSAASSNSTHGSFVASPS